ncbi:MAG TPA: acetyl-CoA carboxylase biotin carboxyl carrier protein [Vicinamibacterales bacterium]|nr:acetyl-CoA carboxylase biotin carboxyl carrier protein [Vicinamibacterales bacterium]
MDLDEIKRLIEFIREQELTEFELEQDGVKIRIKAGGHLQGNVPFSPPVSTLTAAHPQFSHSAPGGHTGPQATSPGGTAGPAAAEDGTELAILKSPIVGTFYRAADPDAKPFADVGDTVKKGQVLCIIEAMKLMNEIDSEYDGEIVNVYVQNGQAVQYGERLFAIRLKSV